MFHKVEGSIPPSASMFECLFGLEFERLYRQYLYRRIGLIMRNVTGIPNVVIVCRKGAIGILLPRMLILLSKGVVECS